MLAILTRGTIQIQNSAALLVRKGYDAQTESHSKMTMQPLRAPSGHMQRTVAQWNPFAVGW